ncbi:MAG: L-2-amino-thiazoline-4-carboxylic acid hydrolase [Chloroflexota bacterium]|nr:L-2-amino-thiazoline-4-carboxylic acid hydrolase [Chloroflexota bacterium]
MPEISLEQKYEMAKGKIMDLWGQIGALSKAIQKKYGSEGLELIANVMGDWGTATAKAVKPMIQGDNAKAVGSFMLSSLNAIGLECKVLELTDDKVHFTVGSCPISADNRKLCDALMHLDRNMIEGLSPKVKFSYPKSIAYGDPYCEVIIESSK